MATGCFRGHTLVPLTLVVPLTACAFAFNAGTDREVGGFPQGIYSDNEAVGTASQGFPDDDDPTMHEICWAKKSTILPTDARFCARENEVCNCTGTAFYGSDRQLLTASAAWVSRPNSSGPAYCAHMGYSGELWEVDPAPNRQKECWCRPEQADPPAGSAAPTTPAPTTLAPTTSAPATMAPTTLTPTTWTPTTYGPTSSAPATSAPTTLAPRTAAPTTAAPTTLHPTAKPTTTTTPNPTTIVPTPTMTPTAYPTMHPTANPTASLTIQPTANPTDSDSRDIGDSRDSRDSRDSSVTDTVIAAAIILAIAVAVGVAAVTWAKRRRNGRAFLRRRVVADGASSAGALALFNPAFNRGLDHNARDIQLGDRVTVFGYGAAGTVQFVGAHHLDGQPRVGVVLETQDGKNNGTIQGHVYFSCDPGYGLLVKPGRIKKLRKASYAEVDGFSPVGGLSSMQLYAEVADLPSDGASPAALYSAVLPARYAGPGAVGAGERAAKIHTYASLTGKDGDDASAYAGIDEMPSSELAMFDAPMYETPPGTAAAARCRSSSFSGFGEPTYATYATYATPPGAAATRRKSSSFTYVEPQTLLHEDSFDGFGSTYAVPPLRTDGSTVNADYADFGATMQRDSFVPDIVFEGAAQAAQDTPYIEVGEASASAMTRPDLVPPETSPRASSNAQGSAASIDSQSDPTKMSVLDWHARNADSGGAGGGTVLPAAAGGSPADLADMAAGSSQSTAEQAIRRRMQQQAAGQKKATLTGFFRSRSATLDDIDMNLNMGDGC